MEHPHASGIADDSVFKLKYNDTVSSLSQAAAVGDLKIVRALLKKGRLPQATDNRGWTAVHSCAAAGQLEALKLILNFRRGSKKYLTNLTTWELETPLVIALKCHSVSLDIVRLLLESGSNPNIATIDGTTPLHYACTKYGNTAVVKLLVEYGAGVNSKQYFVNEYTPLHLAIVEAADTEMVRFLVERCDVNLRDVEGETPLYKASVCGFVEAVELILEKDTSSINTIPLRQFSPLSVAAFKGNERLVRVLLDAGANADVFGSRGFHRYPLTEVTTLPVHLSVGNPEIFRLLLNVTNPRTLLEVANVAPLAVFAMMYGPGTECVEVIHETQLPECLKAVDYDRVADFVMGYPIPCDQIIKKCHLLFKYYVNLDAENMFKYVAGKVTSYEPGNLLRKLKFLRLLAKIGVSSATAFESKNQIIHILREGQQEEEEVNEVIKALCRPVLTLKQISRDAARRYITHRAGNSWTAYTTIRDFHFPATLKEYLWCQAFS